METGGIEPPTSWLQTRREDSVTTNPGKGLRLNSEPLAHHLPIEINQADIDPNLAAIVESWPALPESVKAALVAMVEAVKR